jgi:chromosome segregation ATPase
VAALPAAGKSNHDGEHFEDRTQQSEAPTSLSAPVEPAAPLSKLARAEAALVAADDAMRQIRLEIDTLQERLRKVERELTELDRNTGSGDQDSDVGERLDRCLALQQDLSVGREMLVTLNQRLQHTGRQRSQADQNVAAIRLRIAGYRHQFQRQESRIQQQRRVVADAENQVAGHRNVLGNLERQLATYKTELQELAGPDSSEHS